VADESRKSDKKKNATRSMIEIFSRSQSGSPAGTPIRPPLKERSSLASPTPDNPSSTDLIHGTGVPVGLPDVPPRPPSVPTGTDSATSPSSGNISRDSPLSDDTKRSRTLESITRSLTSSASLGERRSAIGSIGSATASAAKKWGWNVLGKGDQGKAIDAAARPGTPDHPIGRGRPLPPPGTPLPPPERFSFRPSPISVPRRKPVPPPPLPERPQEENMKPRSKPPLPKRKTLSSRESTAIFTDKVLVVKAPEDPEPSSPSPDSEFNVVDDGKSENIPSTTSASQVHRQQSGNDARPDFCFEQVPSLSENGATQSSSSSPSTPPDRETMEMAYDHFRTPQNVVL
jgi:hypothetical protein